jgi:hypothetical protein
MKKLIELSLETLIYLEKFIISLNHSSDNIRIKTCVMDINRCIEHGKYYTNDISLYNPYEFRFHNALVNLLDSVKDNDWGLLLS